MAKPPKKHKQAALLNVPQTTDECALNINKIGVLAREADGLKAAMNDEIAAITDRYTPLFAPIKEELAQLEQGVKVFCEAHRLELTNQNKVKTANFVTGSVQWRQKPPSVVVKGVEDVLNRLAGLGLERFIRTKPEINKEAILNEPDAIVGVNGLTIKTGEEDFIITPFEQEHT